MREEEVEDMMRKKKKKKWSVEREADEREMKVWAELGLLYMV